jgi:hypothetical protein
MTPRAVFLVVTRLLALWCAVSAVSALASAPALDWGEPGEFRRVQAMSVTSLVLVPLVCGALLWSASGWLARHAAGDLGSPDGAVPLDAAQLFAVGMSILGLVVIVQVLPELAQAAAFAVAARWMPNQQESIDTSLQLERWVYQQAGIARLVSLVARLAVGLVLLLGPRYVWSLLKRFAGRTFGSSFAEDEPKE